MAISALVSKLRRLLGESAITGRGEIALNLPANAFIDVERARNGIHRAKSLIAAERWWDAYTPAVTARYIAERQFMRGETAPWIDEVRRELEDVHLAAIECTATVDLAVGGHEEPNATRSARRLIELAPYRESGYRLLMEALEREGNCAEALVVYETLRGVLMDELGSAPSAKTQELHSRLLAET
jgi:DNA-binding SARP family transcriptional activator